MFISDAILSEVVKVLRGEKFAWPGTEIEKAQQEIVRITRPVKTTKTLHIITADPSDNRILECAATAQANYIVSGDQHLLRFKTFGDARVLKVAIF